jgi:hypothetical protein
LCDWDDEDKAKLYVIYEGQLLRLPLSGAKVKLHGEMKTGNTLGTKYEPPVYK